MGSVLLDAAGRRRSPATIPGFGSGRPPRNKGLRYPPDPPSVEEIVAVMRTVEDRGEGVRLRALIVILWRAGLRISEALALAESDLDPVRGAVLVRRGKGGRRREVGMDRWGFDQIRPWVELRTTLPVGSLFCVAWSDRRSAMGSVLGARGTPGGCCAGRCPSALRPASASACSRGRDGPRRDPDHGHPAAVRACRSRRHLGVFARD
jgi:integrase